MKRISFAILVLAFSGLTLPALAQDDSAELAKKLSKAMAKMNFAPSWVSPLFIPVRSWVSSLSSRRKSDVTMRAKKHF